MKREILSTLSKILLFILLGISLATVVVTGRFWWQQQLNGPPCVATTADALKDKLEAYDKRADELEKLLTLLLGVSTIYAIALGWSAYQQLKDSADKLESLRKDAEKKIEELPDKISNIEKEANIEIRRHMKESTDMLESLRREAQKKIEQLPGEIASIKKQADDEIQKFVVKVETKFPLFADIDLSIRTIMGQLMRLLPVIDSSEWSHAEYEKQFRQGKQEILFYEKTLAALMYFDLQRVGQTVSEIYHGLGNFYGLKYYWESKQDEDKERARFYLERAILHDTENTGALNDRGYLAIYLDNPPDNLKARALFNKSLVVDPEQQRARYDLAFLEHVDKKYHESEQLLSAALGKTHWQNKLPARNRDSILYNRACAYARLGELESAIKDLEEVFSDGADYTASERTELVTYFKNDIRPNEDLYSITQNESFNGRINIIAERLPQHKNRPQLSGREPKETATQ